MTRTILTSACLALALATAPALTFAQSPAAAAAAPAAVTPADAGPFLGSWTIAGESQMGPFAMALSLTVAEGKVGGTLSSDMQPEIAITDITKSAGTLVLRYSFDYEGNPVPVVVSLTPKADKLDATFSFADGAFEMTGIGSKVATP